MGVTVAVTRVAANTGTGDQTITTPDLGGLVPKAVRIWVTRATADGAVADHAILSYGAATGVNAQWAVGYWEEHGQASSDTGKRGVGDQCMLILDPAAGAVDGEATFKAFVANGVTITWGNAPAAAYLLTVELWAGSSLSARAERVNLLSVGADSSLDVTSIGFEADMLFTAAHNLRGQGTPAF